MRLYYLLGRLLSPFALVALYGVSMVTSAPRARIVVENEKKEILLLKTWLGAGRWGLPGGGIDRGEYPEKAAVRELYEETGISLSADALQPLFTLQHRKHEEVVFIASTSKESLPCVTPNKFEVETAAWFSPGELPVVDSLTERILARMAPGR